MASQGTPKSYLEFSPPGRPGVRFKPDQAVVPGNIGSRRAHMDAFFKHMGHTDEVLLEKERRVAVQWICTMFHNAGFRRSGFLHFEFEVDRSLWFNIFEDYRKQGQPGPEWPWAGKRPLRTDTGHGLSQVYADFLERKKAAATAGKEATLAEGSKALETSKEALSLKWKDKPATKAAFDKGKQPARELQSSMWGPISGTASVPSRAPVPVPAGVPALDLVPTAPSTSTLNRMKPPMMPKLELRQKAWEQVFGDTAIVEPVVGPFEIRLPSWLDFEGLVLGSDGMGLHRVNSDVIDADLVITWEEGLSSHPKKLIVGFSDRADRYAADRRSNLERLTMLWDQVSTWASIAYQGRPIPLELHLHGESVIRMGKILDKPVGAEAPIRKLWGQIQENPSGSIRDLEQRLQSNEARTRRVDDEIRALKSQRDEAQALRAPDPTPAKTQLGTPDSRKRPRSPGLQGVEVAGLSKMFLELSELSRDIPLMPERAGMVEMHDIALKVAPMILEPDMKRGLMRFLDAKKEQWHCVEDVCTRGISAEPSPQRLCRLNHHQRCYFVRVQHYLGTYRLEFQDMD